MAKGNCSKCGKAMRIRLVEASTAQCRECWLKMEKQKSDNGMCIDCGAPLSRWSTGRCAPCHRKPRTEPHEPKHITSEYFDTTDWLRRPLL